MNRRRLLQFVVFVAGIFYVVEFFLPDHVGAWKNPFTPFIGPIGNFVLVVTQLAIGVGALNLFRYHLKEIARRRRGYGNSIALIVAFCVMAGLGFWNYYEPTSVAVSAWFDLVFNRLYQPLGSTVFSLLAFYLVAAAFRAFKLRTLEATILVVCATIVMLGQVPTGILLTSWIPEGAGWLKLEHLTSWLLHIANTAGVRALAMGASVGSIAMALRVWLGIERGMFIEPSEGK